MKNVLVIAPHADDEILGCGATMGKLSENGFHITVLVVTSGISFNTIKNEALKSHKIYKNCATVFLQLPTLQLDILQTSEIANKIYNIVEQIKPELVFLPHKGDIHSDHTKVFEASMVALRPKNKSIVKMILSYETLSETEWANPNAADYFIPNYYINVDKYINYKISAMKEYKSQLMEFPHPRSIEAIMSLSIFRGSTIGVEHAEAFMLIRGIMH